MSEDLIGAKALDKKLKQLHGKVAKRIVRRATMAGARVIRKQAKANVPVRADGMDKKTYKGDRRAAGTLKKSIYAKTVKKTPFELVVAIRVRGVAFYGRFLEFGTRFITARPWLRPAFDAKRNAAKDKIIKTLWKGIQKEANK